MAPSRPSPATAPPDTATVPAPEARFNGPVGIAVDARGRIVVADTYNDRVRAIEPDGSVVTIAGPAALSTPSGVTIDAAGNIYVADTGDGVVRSIAPDGSLSTIGSLFVDAPRHPVGIAVDTPGTST
jgi:DNA-binding beta-propeller fold protein YncE